MSYGTFEYSLSPEPPEIPMYWLIPNRRTGIAEERLMEHPRLRRPPNDLDMDETMDSEPRGSDEESMVHSVHEYHDDPDPDPFWSFLPPGPPTDGVDDEVEIADAGEGDSEDEAPAPHPSQPAARPPAPVQPTEQPELEIGDEIEMVALSCERRMATVLFPWRVKGQRKDTLAVVLLQRTDFADERDVVLGG